MAVADCYGQIDQLIVLRIENALQRTDHRIAESLLSHDISEEKIIYRVNRSDKSSD